MSQKLIIIGLGETAKMAYEYFTCDSEFEVACFAVDRGYLKFENHEKIPVVAIDELTEKYPPSVYHAFVAISSGGLNRARSDAFVKIKKLGYTCASYVSTRAFVWRNVKIGENCFILEGNTLQSFVEVGNNVTIWSGNHIGHRTRIKDNCFISSHCVISGYCEVGEYSYLGVNCTLEDEVKIGKDNFIGAGALIRKSTKERSLYQVEQTELSKVNTHRLFKVRPE